MPSVRLKKLLPTKRIAAELIGRQKHFLNLRVIEREVVGGNCKTRQCGVRADCRISNAGSIALIRGANTDALPNKAICPLCGSSNDCAMTQTAGLNPESPQRECWCMSVKIGPDILAKVPEPLRGVACICAKCAAGLSRQR